MANKARPFEVNSYKIKSNIKLCAAVLQITECYNSISKHENISLLNVRVRCSFNLEAIKYEYKKTISAAFAECMHIIQFTSFACANDRRKWRRLSSHAPAAIKTKQRCLTAFQILSHQSVSETLCTQHALAHSHSHQAAPHPSLSIAVPVLSCCYTALLIGFQNRLADAVLRHTVRCVSSSCVFLIMASSIHYHI